MSYRIVFSDDCSGDEVVAFPLTAEQVNQLRKHMYQLGRDVEAIEDLPQKLYDVAIWVEKNIDNNQSRKPWDYLDGILPSDDAPVSDNPSGLYCPECRSVRMLHCSSPEFCGGMTPMKEKNSQLPLPEGRGLEEKMLTTSDQPGRKAID